MSITAAALITAAYVWASWFVPQSVVLFKETHVPLGVAIAMMMVNAITAYTLYNFATKWYEMLTGKSWKEKGNRNIPATVAVSISAATCVAIGLWTCTATIAWLNGHHDAIPMVLGFAVAFLGIAASSKAINVAEQHCDSTQSVPSTIL